jgi:hypothetical protein
VPALQRGCGVRGWGRHGLETGARGRGEGAEGVDVDGAPEGRTARGGPSSVWPAEFAGNGASLRSRLQREQEISRPAVDVPCQLDAVVDTLVETRQDRVLKSPCPAGDLTSPGVRRIIGLP